MTLSPDSSLYEVNMEGPISTTVIITDKVRIDHVSPIIYPYPQKDKIGVIEIAGEGFCDKKEGKSQVTISINNQNIPLEDKILNWGKNRILLEIPRNTKIEEPKVMVKVKNKSGAESKEAETILVRDVVLEAIRLKEEHNTEKEIVNHLFHLQKMYLDKHPDETENLFGSIQLTSSEITALKKVDFSPDFIAKVEGQQQYLSLGISDVYLKKTHDFVTAPTARLFILPKGFYSPRRPILSYEREYFILDRNFLKAIAERTDLTVGFTTSTPTAKDDPTAPSKNYTLVGVALEINRFLHLTAGGAFLLLDESSIEEKTQWFFGLNLDPNFTDIPDLLKTLGISGR